MNIILISIFAILINTIRTQQSCTLPETLVCLPNINPCTNATFSVITASQFVVYNCPEPLILIATQLNIQGTYSSLTLIGSSINISTLSVSNLLNATISNQIILSGNISVEGNILFVSSNDSVSGVNLVIQNGIVTSSKFISIGFQNITFQGSYLNTQLPLCLYKKININTISNILSQEIAYKNINSLNLYNFSVFLQAVNINLLGSNIKAATVIVLTSNNFSMVTSALNTTGKSCQTNTGLGRGSIIQYQNSYCTSGSSSCGYGAISSSYCSNITQYFQFLSHSMPYMSKGPILSTGSGGYGFNTQPTEAGAGGGIIFILSNSNIQLTSSQILASGGDVSANDNLSGGSGGTIFMTSTSIYGYGLNNISAAGGSSYNNNGSGSGGLVKISYQYSYQQPSQSLWVNINQGYMPDNTVSSLSSNGIFYGPLCQAGEEAYYLGCKTCPPGFYSTLGDPICRACPYSKQNIQSNTSGNSFITFCFSPREELAIFRWLTPGNVSLFSLALYILSLIIFAIIGLVLKKKIKKQKLTSSLEVNLQEAQKDVQGAKILSMQLKNSKSIKSYELIYHVHRISCFGYNTEQSPWVLPQKPPNEVRKYVLPQAFQNFAVNFNNLARWSKFQYYLTKFFILFYPLYWFYMDFLKKSKYHKLLNLLQEAKQFNLINNYDYEDKNIITIKFSKNKDYTNCYLDFFIYDKMDLKYFNLTSPFIIYLSGEGNFLRPFYLEDQEIFFKTMFYIVNRTIDKVIDLNDQKKQLFGNLVSQKQRQQNSANLMRFLRKLNTITCTIDLSALQSHLIETLTKLIELMEEWNNSFFHKLVVQIDLIVMLSHIRKGNEIENEVHILSKKNNQDFHTFVSEMMSKLQLWDQKSLKIGLFVYNPQQQIPNESSQHRFELLKYQFETESDMNDQSIIQPLITRYDSMEEQKVKLLSVVSQKLERILKVLRFYMFSHRLTRYSEYTINYLQSLFILMQTMLLFIWSIKIEIPYVLMNLICPFVGIIWFVSDSYGFGKLYLILNFMSLINEITTLISYSIIQAQFQKEDYSQVEKIIICSVVNILIILIMMFIGCRALTFSKKLSLKKQE